MEKISGLCLVAVEFYFDSVKHLNIGRDLVSHGKYIKFVKRKRRGKRKFIQNGIVHYHRLFTQSAFVEL